MKNQKLLWAALGTAGGLTAIGIGTMMIWNSRQMKLLRLTKRANRVLYKTGAALQSVATAVED